MPADKNDVAAYAPVGLGVPGKATCTAGAASAVTRFRPDPAAGTAGTGCYVVFTASSTAAGPGFHIAFGDAGLGAPSAADMPINDVDGWIRLWVPVGVTHFRIFGEGASAGSVYAYVG